jgi:hypothetical protein
VEPVISMTSQLGVGSSVGIATWIFGWRWFHQFDASEIGIEDIKLPFAVAADFGFVVGKFRIEGKTILVKLVEGAFHVGDPETEMILHAEFLVIGIGRNV